MREVSKVETEKVRILFQAIHAGNLSSIAGGLGYTPSGISRAISSLEKEMGFPLLIRHSSGVSPTFECECLLPVMQELVNQAEQCKQAIASIRGLQVGTVVVATVYNLFHQIISQMINRFVNDYPGINVEFITGTSSFLAGKLENKEIDLCLISRRVGSFKWTPLFTDDLIVWVHEQHPCAEQTAYPIERFAHDPYISLFPGTEPNDILFFEKENLRPNVRFSASDIDMAYSMVEAGLGVTVVNGVSAESRVCSGRVVTLYMQPRQRVEVGLAYSHGDSVSPAARRFIRFAVDYFCSDICRGVFAQK
jgi:DNA-binding transcriptional LysR family regulator